MALSQPNQGTMVIRGDYPFKVDQAEDIAARYDVDREWLLAADFLHEMFPKYEDLKNGPAREKSALQSTWQEAYLAFDPARVASWPAPGTLVRRTDVPPAQPYLTVDGCESELADFSGEDLLKIHLAITQELIKRNGNMR